MAIHVPQTERRDNVTVAGARQAAKDSYTPHTTICVVRSKHSVMVHEINCSICIRNVPGIPTAISFHSSALYSFAAAGANSCT
jgi:hypothetical protein